jgi:predicted nucleic acid-binding protein
MNICFDTNAYSALMRGSAEVKKILERADSLIMPTVVLGELYAGFSAGRRKQENNQKLRDFLATPGIKVAQINQETAARYGTLVQQLKLQGNPIPTNDIWIAAVAFETGAVLLTEDRHFSVIPLLEIIAYTR